MSRFTEFYNHNGMMLDHERTLFYRIPVNERFALKDEHHRRTEAIAVAWGERGEIINYHDARFEAPEVFACATVIDEIAAERQRQISVEGWTPEHDDTHDGGTLAKAAACYAEPSAAAYIWPWEQSWFKRSTRRRDLVKAAALIVAEIERIDRASAPTGEQKDSAE